MNIAIMSINTYFIFTILFFIVKYYAYDKKKPPLQTISLG